MPAKKAAKKAPAKKRSTARKRPLPPARLAAKPGAAPPPPPGAITYIRPPLYPKQEAAFFGRTRFGVCEGTTKAGKTMGALAWLVELWLTTGKPGRNYWWVAPTYTQAKIAYGRTKRALPASVIVRSLSTFPQEIEAPNGATLSFRSADNADSLYGDDVYAVVLDEYTRAKEDTFQALLSVLTATGGPLRMVGNVVGRSVWGYRLARLAEQGDPEWTYSKLTCLDAIAGYRAIGQRALAARLEQSVAQAKALLSPEDFAMLYMAEAPEDETNPLPSALLAARTTPPSERPTVVYGLDLARAQDYTELLGLDDQGQWTTHWRTRGGSWAEIKRQVKKRVGSVPVLADSTGVGDPIVEDLSLEGVEISGFKYGPTSRRELLARLITGLHSGPFTFPKPIAEQLAHLQVTYTATGPDYRIPEPMHDDGMMALALAIRCFDAIVGAPVAPASAVASSADVDAVRFAPPEPDEPGDILGALPPPRVAPPVHEAPEFGGLGAGW